MRHICAAAAVAASLPLSIAGVLPAHARDAYVVKVPTIGCIERSTIERLHSLRDDGGAPAANVLTQSALETGQCMPIPAGVSVVEEDDDIIAGLTRVRAPGEPVSLWVRNAALSED